MNNKSEKLVDFQAPENSLVLTPLMGRKEALKMFYKWYNTVDNWEPDSWAHDSTINWKAN